MSNLDRNLTNSHNIPDLKKLLSMGKITPDQVVSYENVLSEMKKAEQIEKERVESPLEKSKTYSKSIVDSLRRQLGALFPFVSQYAINGRTPKEVTEKDVKNTFNMAGYEFDNQVGVETFKNLHNEGLDGHRISDKGLLKSKLEQRIAGKLLTVVNDIKSEDLVTRVNVPRSNGEIDGLDKGWTIDKKQSKESLMFGMVVVINEKYGVKKTLSINVLEKNNPELFNIVVKRSDGTRETDWNIREVFTDKDREYAEVINNKKNLKKVIALEELMAENSHLKGKANNAPDERSNVQIKSDIKKHDDSENHNFEGIKNSGNGFKNDIKKPEIKDDSKIPASDVRSKYGYRMNQDEKVVSVFDKTIDYGDVVLINTPENMRPLLGYGEVIGLNYDGQGNYLVDMGNRTIVVDRFGMDGVIVKRS